MAGAETAGEVELALQMTHADAVVRVEEDTPSVDGPCGHVPTVAGR